MVYNHLKRPLTATICMHILNIFRNFIVYIYSGNLWIYVAPVVIQSTEGLVMSVPSVHDWPFQAQRCFTLKINLRRHVRHRRQHAVCSVASVHWFSQRAICSKWTQRGTFYHGDPWSNRRHDTCAILFSGPPFHDGTTSTISFYSFYIINIT